VFFGQRCSGRPFNAADHYTSKYLDLPNEPLYPFGHGLSYTRFSHADLRVSPDSLTAGGQLEISVQVTNDGARAGEETLFVFTHDCVASVTRPMLELRGFAKIHLQPGQSGRVTLTLAASQLAFLGADLRPTLEPGEVEILVGPCAERSRLLCERIRLR